MSDAEDLPGDAADRLARPARDRLSGRPRQPDNGHRVGDSHWSELSSAAAVAQPVASSPPTESSGGVREVRESRSSQPVASSPPTESSREAASEAAYVEIRNALECLLLARGGPIRLAELRKVMDVDEAEIRATLAALQVEYAGRGLQILEVAGGYQLCTRPEYGSYVQRLLRIDETEPLTRATLEALAIVAYRQPITRAEVDAVRGVQSVYHLMKLQDRRLIREVGRRPGPGRPILYGTTEGFLRYFGLKDLGALPPLGEHDRSIVLPAPVP